MWKLNYYIAKIMILIVFCNGGVVALKIRCTHRNKYDVLTFTSTVYLQLRIARASTSQRSSKNMLRVL